MTQKADLAVFVGRFQPFHLGHLHALKHGLDRAENVLVLVGDTGGPRGLKNPWTFAERHDMIARSIPFEHNDRVHIDVAYDHPSDTDWIAQVSGLVSETCFRLDIDPSKVILIGHDKDESSFYVHCFPQWKFHDTGYEDLGDGVVGRYDATAIRQLVWKGDLHYARGVMPDGALKVLTESVAQNPETYQRLREEYANIQRYRDSWKGSPFPPVFVTTDCVVVQSGHILLIKRGENPGKGLWALPGGFIDQRESIEDCAIRELIEETDIKLQPEVLKRCIQSVHVFDRAGGVSEEDRGRIITHVHTIKLDDSKPLPKVRGGDDAAEARWVPICDISFREIFSDHGKIIQASLARI